MKIKLLALLLVVGNFATAQPKIADIGFGIKPGDSKGLYSFNFSFNRTEATEAAPGGYLWSANHVLFKDGRLYSKPSFEANLGNVDSSPNNILLALPVQYTIKLGKGQSLFFDVAPSFNASNKLDTGLYYVEAGPKYLIYDTDNNFGYFFLAEALFQSGKRYNVESNDLFNRYVGIVTAKLLLIQNDDKTHRLELASSYKAYAIDGDALAPEKNLHLFSFTTSYKFKNLPIGLNLKYINGYEQPLFKRMEAWTFGIAFYQR
jgi:hypothetical protein